MMSQANCGTADPLTIKSHKTGGTVKRVGALLFSILAIIFFLFYIGPQLEKLPMIHPLMQFIEERDIKANMYFYTEVEEFSDAQVNINNSMNYPPRTAP